MKVHNNKNGFRYGIYAIDESLIDGFMNHGNISNITLLRLSDLVEEAEQQYAVMEDTDNPLFIEEPCFTEYLHRKFILDSTIQEVYVSPLAAYHIYKECFHAKTAKMLELYDTVDYDDWD